MKDQDLDSYNQEDDLEIRKSFSRYIIDIEHEIQKYGFHVAQSEILAFVMEKIVGNKPGEISKLSLQDLTKRDIISNAEEISHYIVNRKFPFIGKFQRSDDKLNKFQLALKHSRIGKISDQSSLRLFKFSNFLNSILIIIALSIAFQSVYTLSYIITSNEGIDQTFPNFNGKLPYFNKSIYGYNQIINPLTIIVVGIFFFISLIFSYTVLNLPTISRVIPNLNDYYNSLILKIKLNFVLAISFISYMFLGSVSVINNERINGYEPIGDLGIPFLISVLLGIIGGYILILLRKERSINYDYSKPKSVTQLTILVTNFIVVVFTLLIFTYLVLVVKADLEIIDGLGPNETITNYDYDLSVLNFVSLISFMLFFVMFTISSLLNHSTSKNQWHKFIVIQLIIQSFFVLTYSALEYYMIITYNDYVTSIGSTQNIPITNLTQGIMKFYGSMIIAYVLLKISK